jgi:hypothetical protein
VTAERADTGPGCDLPQNRFPPRCDTPSAPPLRP